MTSILDRAKVSALIPEDAATEIIKAATEESAVLRLAKRRPNMTRNQTRIPALATKPVAGFVTGDTGVKPLTDVEFENVYINAETLACVVPIPEEVADDTDYDLETELMPEIAEAFGVAIDAAILFGVNAPASWGNSVREGAVAASNTAVTSSFADIYDAIMGPDGAIGMVEEDGYMPTGHVAAPTFRAQLRGLRDANGVPIYNATMQGGTSYQLDGQPIYFPGNGAFNAATTDFITGDWDQLQVAMRTDLTMKIFTEGVVTDSSGNIIYNLMQQDMYALRFMMRLGYVITNPLNRLNTNDTTRYPFSVLTTS